MAPIGLRDQQKVSDSRNGQIILDWKSPKYHGKNIIVVEGKWDEIFFGQFCTDSTAILQSGGCSQLVSIYKAIKVAIPTNSIAIKDSDFDRVNSSTISIPGFFYTDYHDCEMMVLASITAFDKTMRELSLSITKDDLVVLFERLRHLSLLKWFCYSRPEMRPSFKGINICSLDQETMSDIHKLADMAIEYTRKKGRDVSFNHSELTAFCESHTSYDCFEVVNGHDMITLLLHHVNTICKQSYSRDYMTGVLYSNYSIEDFTSTCLYRDIKAHEATLAQGITFFQ